MSEDKRSEKTTIFGGIGALAILAKLKAAGWLLPNVLTMFASIGVYTMMFGFRYAVAIVGLIFIHEMGHWVWMKATGLNPQAPMFLPGIGAYTAMSKMPPDQTSRAWVAFAGPLIGGIGAAVLYWAGLHTANDWLMAAGNTGFFLNLMQLIPAKPFDGGFVLGAVWRWFLIPGTILLIIAGVALHSTLLMIISVISVFGLFRQFRGAANDGTTPASLPQRMLIGVAYLSLCGMLAYLYAMTQSAVNTMR
ncbi:MAG TPA: site-2 protease family protein [Planktothrix sp.]|jgi:Zn-dependent protease